MALQGTSSWTSRERKAAGTFAAAWIAGVVAGWTGLDRSLAAASAEALHPPRPSVAELAARVRPGDPRPAWYTAALALRAEETIAASAPTKIDPNTAGRAEWDRLPGIGPATAMAILDHRRRQGPFTGPEDLLAVRGIGPGTMAKLGPFLEWPAQATRMGVNYPNLPTGDRLPDLNLVDGRFLQTLPGFGPKLAEHLLRERQARGAFRDWSDLLSVEGIGPARLRVLQKATRLRGSNASGGGSQQGQEWNP
jgi:competence ComEA-like helix-hairpin-helix protein